MRRALIVVAGAAAALISLLSVVAPTVSIAQTPPAVTECNNGIDDDGNGSIDMGDRGCRSPDDIIEGTLATACGDDIDNDGDGLIDFPYDPGCTSSNDPDEDSRPVFECSDGLDNDGDGRVDYPADPGCTSATDSSEFDGLFAQCRDGIDNDGDGRIDYPADTGCSSFDDNSEDTTVCTVNCFCSANPDVGGSDQGASDPDPADPNFSNCPDSSTGAVCPLDRQECTLKTYTIMDPVTAATSTGTGYECPSSPNSSCSVDPNDGKRYCSPHTCLSKSTTPIESIDTGEPFPTGDGPRDAAGNCLGKLSLFAGAAKRCRRAGTQTAYQNCCKNKNPTLDDTMGADGEPDQIKYRKEKSSFEFYDNQCDQQDQETSLLADSDYCISLGSYCAERLPLVGCVQRNRGYCCFNSKLAKILQEQGRAQIPSMGGFGSAKNPQCRGFTMEEFQALDFTKINLDGYYSDIRTKGQSTIQGEAQDAARRRFNP